MSHAPVRRKARLINIDRKFCNAVRRAAAAGLETVREGVVTDPRPLGRPTYVPPQQSYMGSPAAMVADEAVRPRPRVDPQIKVEEDE